MKQLPVIIILTILSFFQANGQTPSSRWEFKINAGYNIGGTSPLPLPAEIRRIDSYAPSVFAPHVALEGTRWFNETWGLSAQITLDYKGFTVKDQVKSLHTEIEMGDEKYTGNFTGKNKTQINNAYITVPVMISYRIAEKWTAQLGFYAAYLYKPDFKGTATDGYIRRGSPIGEKTIVNKATFDFSKNQRTFDAGLQVAGEWEFYRNIALRGQLSWGLTPLFPSDFTAMPFTMYNIYGMLGVSYRLK